MREHSEDDRRAGPDEGAAERGASAGRADPAADANCAHEPSIAPDTGESDLGRAEASAERVPVEAASPTSPRSRTAAVRTRYLAWWDAASPNLRGSVLVISAFCFFTVMVVVVKMLGSRLPLSQILLMRQAIVLVMLILVVRGRVRSAMRTNRVGLQVLRAAMMIGAMYFGFTAVLHMPIAESSALSFSQVLWVTIGAILVLGEKVSRRHWIAMVIGFAGILIMLRPTGQAINAYALYSITGAMFGAGITITVRMLGDTEKTETILLWQGFLVLSVLAIPAAIQWVPPSLEDWLWLGALGLTSTVGQWLITRGQQYGEASSLAPLDFIRLLMATAGGYIVFSEVPDMVTIIGAVLVVYATILTVSGNARRRAVPPDPLG